MTRCRFLNETSGVVIDWAGTRSDVQMDRCEFGDVADMVMDNAAAGGRDCGITIVWNYFHGSHNDNSGPSGYGAYIWYNGHNVAQNNGAQMVRMFGFNRCEWPGNDIVETKSNRPLFLNNWVDNGNANPPPEFKLRDSDGGFFIADRIVSSFWSIRGYKSVVIGCVHAGGTGSGINLHGGNYDSQNNIWTPGFPNKTDLGVTPRGNAVATLIAGCTSAVGAVGGDPPSGRYGIVFPRACTIVAHSGSISGLNSSNTVNPGGPIPAGMRRPTHFPFDARYVGPFAVDANIP
jgi:hypothetical protein